ncbi:hypothetical protein L9F63_018126 [Diploptera punctata]|uniref:Uncharacterized protein n=1 Tax=Diploptera punctata TaxID=6984 RepID=A0AAD7ZX49_DIPPU|nr:hypothetical protein L9F63_018126 [Diploptera punctata]
MPELESAEATTKYRLSTPMPFTETTINARNTKSTTISSFSTSTPAAPVNSTASSSVSSPLSKRSKTTTESSSFEQDSTEIMKMVEIRGKDGRRSDLPTPTTSSQKLENNSRSTVAESILSKSQKNRTKQNEALVNTNNLASTKLSRSTVSPKVKVSSNSLKTSRLTASSEVSLSVEDVTSEQLQALEDLQNMIFPENMTISEDGSMFGNLNQSSTLSIINTMKEAVTNSTVRRLVLLLVNNLKENTPEDTRRQLIEALLKMPIDRSKSATKDESFMVMFGEKEKSDKLPRPSGKGSPIISGEQKKSSSKNSNSQTKIAQNKKLDIDGKTTTSTQSPFRTRARKTTQTTTLPPDTTTTSTTILTVTPVRSKSRRPSKLKTSTVSPHTTVSTIGRSSSLETEIEDLATEADTLPQADTRAVELLKSLYSLASRWG